MRDLAVLLLLALSGCGAESWCDRFNLDCDTAPTIERELLDLDGDVWTEDVDCDDHNPDIHPGAAELCDGADNDCDGTIDEGVTTTWYADADGDGYGDDLQPLELCEAALSGFAAIGGDCDDDDGDVRPGADELCLDGVDNDCDGDTDEGTCTMGGHWLYLSQYAARIGTSLSAGDFDGDGSDDLAVGAPFSDEYRAGAVVLLSEPLTGDVSLSAGWPVLSGTQERQYLGGALASPGDVDGDGYDDLFIGAPFSTVGEADLAGEVLLLEGPLHGIADVLKQATLHLAGDIRSQRLGGRLLSSGDLTGDGIVDLLVTDETDDTEGTVHLFSGALRGEHTLDARVASAETSSGNPYASAAVGDLDGDGVDDLVLGDSWDKSEAVVLFRGPLSGDLSAATDRDAVLTGQGGGRDGRSLATGDVDGDGVGDLLVGAPGADAGVVYVLLGPLSGGSDGPLSKTAALTLAGERPSAQAGEAVSSAGDLDGDEQDELLIATLYHEVEEGEHRTAVHLIAGVGAETGRLTFSDAGAMTRALDFPGTAQLLSGFDIDHDGAPDFAAQLPDADLFGNDAGGIWVFSRP